MPITLPVFCGFFLLIVLLITLIEINILRYAYEKIGIDQRYVLALLLLSLLGSYVNIPVAELPAERVVSGQQTAWFGVRYVMPLVQEWPRTIIAVNVGGAVIPTLLSLYLLVKNSMYGSSLLAVAIVTLIVYRLARPVQGLGIVVPIFIPPLVAAITALLLAPQAAPSLAYMSGSLGTLIGADLLNIRRVRGLGAPLASIGGSGTFDGIFLTGILAVLLA